MRRLTWVTLLLLIGVSPGYSANKKTNHSLESQYREAQREFHKNNYARSLNLLEAYIKSGKKGFNKSERLFWVIDQIGYIHLRVNKNPDSAISFFKKFESDDRLNDAQQDAISEWIGVATDWKKEELKPQKVKKPDQLFKFGSKYFNSGIKKK